MCRPEQWASLAPSPPSLLHVETPQTLSVSASHVRVSCPVWVTIGSPALHGDRLPFLYSEVFSKLSTLSGVVYSFTSISRIGVWGVLPVGLPRLHFTGRLACRLAGRPSSLKNGGGGVHYFGWKAGILCGKGWVTPTVRPIGPDRTGAELVGFWLDLLGKDRRPNRDIITCAKLAG